MGKIRADRLLVKRGLAGSRARARTLIEAGKVRADGAVVARASVALAEDCQLDLDGTDHPYVSRGGVKLAGALEGLPLSVTGQRIADLGASTGGFTDCVLQAGASRVYAIDVGQDQLHTRLRSDSRVVCMEQVNARHLKAEDLPEQVDLVLIDASFISMGKLLAAARGLLVPGGRLLGLVKPQFEVGAASVGKRGVVRSDALRDSAVRGVVDEASALGFELRAQQDCCLPGPEGNREVFVLFELKDGACGP